METQTQMHRMGLNPFLMQTQTSSVNIPQGFRLFIEGVIILKETHWFLARNPVGFLWLLNVINLLKQLLIVL